MESEPEFTPEDLELDRTNPEEALKRTNWRVDWPPVHQRKILAIRRDKNYLQVESDDDRYRGVTIYDRFFDLNGQIQSERYKDRSVVDITPRSDSPINFEFLDKDLVPEIPLDDIGIIVRLQSMFLDALDLVNLAYEGKYLRRILLHSEFTGLENYLPQFDLIFKDLESPNPMFGLVPFTEFALGDEGDYGEILLKSRKLTDTSWLVSELETSKLVYLIKTKFGENLVEVEQKYMAWDYEGETVKRIVRAPLILPNIQSMKDVVTAPSFYPNGEINDDWTNIQALMGNPHLVFTGPILELIKYQRQQQRDEDIDSE